MIEAKYKTREDKIGEVRYNIRGTPMKLIDYRNSHDCDVEFQDEYKYIFEHALYQCFIQGKIKNPYDKTVYGAGMLGNGKYKTKYDGQTDLSPDYKCWKNIIERCYKNNNKHPAYYEISTVCDEWLNFQNFAKWYEDNLYEIPNGERLEVDKDILVAGNKQYSPEMCLFVPQKINLLFTNMSRSDGLPNGIQRTSNGKKYMAMYNKEHLGCFETLEEAYAVYANRKEIAIKEKADEYKEFIPDRLYQVLYKYEVKIENDKNYISNMTNEGGHSNYEKLFQWLDGEFT